MVATAQTPDAEHPLPTRLWERYGELRLTDVPDRAQQVASQCVLDWIACALAGSREPLSEILRAEYAGQTGPASILGTDDKAPTTVAALLNGAAGHALDFDDTHSAMGGHPTVPVLPAALAVAEEIGATGAQLLAAYIVGVEIESRVGALFAGDTYRRGWHCTGTHGIFGAAAAVCHLLGADTETFGRAFGLAGSQASGLKINFGTMTKPFHAGHAAERGALAARLALRGFTARPEVVEGKQGMAEATSSGAELRWDRFDRFEDEWLIEETLFKYHAACYLTHSAIESVHLLKQELGRPIVATDEVEQAVVTVHPGNLDVCGIPRPTTGLEAKFSLTATTSLALLGENTSDIDLFVDATVARPEVQSLIEKVDVQTDETLAHTQARVEVKTTAGTGAGTFDTGVPASDLDLQGQKLQAKFDALTRPILGDAAQQMAQNALGVARLPSVAPLVNGAP